MLENVIAAFQKVYHCEPDFVLRSPGRVNLIGEHTDYNDGFVFPLAIKYAQWLAIRANEKPEVKLHSVNMETDGIFSLADFSQKSEGWIRYPQGIAYTLSQNGYKLTGWDGLLMGDLPIGAGLSSSAALEMVVARAFSLLGGYSWDPKKMALLAQKTENQWVGMNCGIMDQLISGCGEAGKAVLIDCRSLDLSSYMLPRGTVIVVMDTMVKHSLISSAYNERREQCMEGAKFFKRQVLRDVSMDEFADRKDQLSEVVMRRCQHVLSENLRTLEAAKCMEANDPKRLGWLMNESHASLQHDFEVSCEELDIMALESQKLDGCFGARMTGGGFGGCAIALVAADNADHFQMQISEIYEKRTGIKPNIFITEGAQGTSVVFSNSKFDQTI